MSILENFEILKKEISQCTKCGLCNGRKNTVPGEGSLENRIMLIGEGPGQDEDEQGRPFVGKSGQLLEKILKSAGFERQSVYITNIVKCRPPQNRAPKEDEMKACYPYLEAQIALINPSIIVTVGSVPTKYLLPEVDEKISAMRGKEYYWKGIKIFPIFHPSYLLRNSSVEVGKPKWQTWQDMLKVREEYLRSKDGRA